MGLIAKLLSFTRKTVNGIFSSDVKVDPGGGANITGGHFSSPGDDSFPLKTDSVIAVRIPNSGGFVIVGYADPLSNPKAEEGEKRIYGRDSAGAEVNEIRLKPDGSILISRGTSEIELKADGSVMISNSLGIFELKTDGTIDMNGATVTLTGDVVSQTGISLSSHTHSGVTTGPGSTGPPQ